MLRFHFGAWILQMQIIDSAFRFADWWLGEKFVKHLIKCDYSGESHRLFNNMECPKYRVSHAEWQKMERRI